MVHSDYSQVGSIEVRLIEECAELIAAISKSQRFGRSNFHPNRPDRNNSDDILDEIEDVERLCLEMRESLPRRNPSQSVVGEEATDIEIDQLHASCSRVGVQSLEASVLLTGEPVIISLNEDADDSTNVLTVVDDAFDSSSDSWFFVQGVVGILRSVPRVLSRLIASEKERNSLRQRELDLLTESDSKSFEINRLVADLSALKLRCLEKGIDVG